MLRFFGMFNGWRFAIFNRGATKLNSREGSEEFDQNLEVSKP